MRDFMADPDAVEEIVDRARQTIALAESLGVKGNK